MGAPLSPAVIGAAGCACSVVAVIAGGHAYTATSTPSTSWLRLIAPEGFDAGDSPLFGLLLFTGIAGLVVCWIAAIHAVNDDLLSSRQVRLIGSAWAMPLILAPPMISKDVYAYAAGAVMQQHGLDVYRASPSALGRLHTRTAAGALDAVDPRWRHVFSPYGPIATAVERFAGLIGGGNSFAILIVFRVVAAVGVVAVAQSAAALAGSQETRALVLVGLNPLLLVHALSAAHFEALMCAFITTGLLATARRRWTLAIVLACAAGLTKAPGLVVVPAVIAWHATRFLTLSRGRRAWIVSADCFTAGAALATMSVLVPDGWGWLRTVLTPTGGNAASSASGVVAAMLQAVLRPGAATVVATVVAAALAIVILVCLGATMTRRPLVVSVGYGLLAIALLAPVTYPWYLLWGVTCALAVEPCGLRRDVLVALCAVGTVVSVPGLPGPVAGALSLASLGLAVAAVARRWRCRNAAVRKSATAKQQRTATG